MEIELSGATLFELAVHYGMELYSCDATRREEFVRWYIETKGGTFFPIDNICEDLSN